MDLVFGRFVTSFNRFAVGDIGSDDFMAQVSRYSTVLRVDFLRSLLRQDMTYFDSKAGGSPSVQATHNGNLVTSGISEKLSLFVQSCATFVTAFIVAFIVQWKLTLITLCVVPSIVLAVGIATAIEQSFEARVMTIQSSATELAEEVFSTISTVHAFWLQPIMASRYENVIADMQRVGSKKSPWYGVVFGSEYFCIYTGYALAFWQGVRMLARGEIKEVGDVVTVIFAVIVAATSLTQIAPQIIVIAKAAAAADELFRVIDHKTSIDPLSTDGMIPDNCIGEVELRDLEFAYPTRPDACVLHGMSLSIPAGKNTALVGTSGSGKSTIVGLLERWYDPTAGAVLLDGLDVRQLNVAWLRTRVRLVQQEPVLFSGTIFDNVAFGLVGTPFASAPYEEKLALVREACRDAFADEFIEKLPNQYDTQVGERARMMSGGQRQRIAIARSIVSRPAVLVLDEATSALDPTAEKVVQAALDNISVGRTTITIAHRMSTVQKADNIAVVSSGTIIEQGNHADLIAKGGAYAKLVQVQQLEEQRRQPETISDKSEADGGYPLATMVSLKHTDGVYAPTMAVPVVDNDKIETEETMGYSLLHCLWLLIKEQRDLRFAYAVMAVVGILSGGAFPAQAVIFSKALQAFQVTGSEAVHRGDFWALMFFVVSVAGLIIYFVLGYTANVIIQKVARRYRRELFQITMQQEIAFFDKEQNATGAVCSRLMTTVSDIYEVLGVNFGLMVINIATVICVSILGIACGWKLGLVCVFAALPPLILSGYLRIRLEHKLEKDTAARFAASAAVAAEAAAAIRTVASLTLENTMLDRYREKLDTVADRSTKALTFTMLWFALAQSINFLAMALGFWYGAKLVAAREYSNEQFFVVFYAVVVGGENAASFFTYSTSITKATASANYLFWLRARVPPIDNSFSPGAERPPSHGCAPLLADHDGAHVDCQSVTFSYPSRPQTKVLQGIDFSIPAGSFVAFVGPSGCGKSTVIGLLNRFFDPDSGDISVDGRVVRDLAPAEHRRHLALVQQEPVLYHASIRDNIAMGLPNATASDEQIAAACRAANLEELVASLPDGLATDVGARGSKLSGGQRQRVAIARALIREPRVLLLDEATSALDTASEKSIQAALEGAAAKRTTVAVAHRLSTIKSAHCIYVLRAGRIVEQGTHRELLDRQGVYYEMCKGQALDSAE
ncbi:hypothetical protein ANO11243_062810 [Dothideomycetidae sp. 11243]|nr:hypothetical protein ANO11243_062810 [fungal sp. No.11243]